MQGEGAEGHRCSIPAVERAPCSPGLHPGPAVPDEQVELPFFLFLELSGCLGSCVFTTVGFPLPCQFCESPYLQTIYPFYLITQSWIFLLADGNFLETKVLFHKRKPTPPHHSPGLHLCH